MQNSRYLNFKHIKISVYVILFMINLFQTSMMITNLSSDISIEYFSLSMENIEHTANFTE